MSDAVIVAFITGLCSIVGQYFISRKRSEDDQIQAARREQSQTDRLNQIERKIDEHNGYAKRFGEIEKAIVEIKKDFQYLTKK